MIDQAAGQVALEYVYAWLISEYGTPVNEGRPDPLDELISAILSQHTSDSNSRTAFESIRSRFHSWSEVAEAPAEEVADAIRCGGLADTKAPRIKDVLVEVLGKSGDGDLGWLAHADIGLARDYLASLPGVGPKTAACVLLFSLGRRAFPVDTHVQRMAQRLGLVPKSSSPARTQQHLESVVPEEQMYAFHINLIRHGRRICRARRPLCEMCGLRSVCRFYSMETASTDGAVI
ncbi:MAG: endonuclease III [Gammaproteobacteria bacterium]|jgi:endonuclease-3|nr:endonuclease III [Gammaproteobacteria bacterium]